MKCIYYIAALLISTPVFATSITGKLAGGGGTDDMRIVIRGEQGSNVEAYCAEKCGDWFQSDKDEVMQLKPSLKGKKVTLQYQSEQNHGRIAGPSDDERLNFVKKITFEPKK